MRGFVFLLAVFLNGCGFKDIIFRVFGSTKNQLFHLNCCFSSLELGFEPQNGLEILAFSVFQVALLNSPVATGFPSDTRKNAWLTEKYANINACDICFLY
jgi:hypothetical protein